MPISKDPEKFRELLDQEYEWPHSYAFKFIVPADQQSNLLKILKNRPGPVFTLSFRESSGGKYVSITAVGTMDSSLEVVEVYRSVAGVKGLLSL